MSYMLTTGMSLSFDEIDFKGTHYRSTATVEFVCSKTLDLI
jgi:hypothetical protein